MKKLLVLFLLVLFLFNLSGYFIWFKIEQSQIKSAIRNEIKKKVKTCDMIVFHFSESEFNNLIWEKQGEEFEFNGLMYDIVQCSKTASGFEVKCLSDEKETVLFAQLDELVKNAMGTSGSTKNPVKKLSKEYCNFIISLPALERNGKEISPNKIFFDSDCNLTISTPPPKLGHCLI